MCRDAVAAPRALQLIVYPIFLKKSLHFCEKSSRNKLFFKNSSGFEKRPNSAQCAKAPVVPECGRLSLSL